MDHTVTSANARQLGIDISIPVACPNCRHSGNVMLENLGHLLCCRHCGDKFWLGRNGMWNSAERSGKLLIHCPRCQTVNEFPGGINTSAVNCVSCHFAIPLQASEPAPVQTQSRRYQASESKKHVGFTFAWQPIHAWWLGGSLGLLLLAASWWLMPRTDPRLVALVKGQMAALLSGDMAAAEETVIEGQISHYQRWLKVDFAPSLERKTLTSIPTFTLETAPIDYQSTLVTIVLSNAKGPPIQFVQVWRRTTDDDWRFAPAETRQHLEAAWAEKLKQADYSD